MKQVHLCVMVLMMFGGLVMTLSAEADDEVKGPKGKKPVELVKGRPIKVLFVGNSYTSIGSGLPIQLERVAKLKGSRLRLQWDRWAKGGSTIGQRWKMTLSERMEGLQKHNGTDPAKREVQLTLPDTISKGKYDFIILQQHSRGRAIVSESKPVVQAAHQQKTRVAFFMTWSGRKEAGPAFPQQEKLVKAYIQASQNYQSGLVPCGLLWQKIKLEMPKLKIYRDGGHPSDLGHHVNALMFYVWLTGHDVRNLASARMKGLSSNDEKKVRALVMQTYVESAKYGK